MLLSLYTRAQAAWLNFRSRFEREDGIVATEYMVLLVLVALAIIVGATALGLAINDKLKETGGKIKDGF